MIIYYSVEYDVCNDCGCGIKIETFFRLKQAIRFARRVSGRVRKVYVTPKKVESCGIPFYELPSDYFNDEGQPKFW